MATETGGSHSLGSPSSSTLVQLPRTGEWLRTLPMARFDHANGAIGVRARALINAVVEVLTEACRTCEETHPERAASADCPPVPARLLEVANHGLGDQLLVVTADLGRVLSRCWEQPPAGRLARTDAGTAEHTGAGLLLTVAQLEAQALQLRSTPVV